MWQYLEYWIRIITPIAEEEGIRLGIHPCDPPVAVLGGIPQLLRNFNAYKRLIEIYPSDSNAIEFCQGTFAEMQDDVDIYEKIRYFGERKKILYVHFRNVSGPVPTFHEEFINTGYVDMYRAMQTYWEVGFDGFFIDDHVPQTFQDTPWGHRGRAFANGYIQALIEAVKKQASSSLTQVRAQATLAPTG
jgi:mannonate dehydratase